MAMTPPAMAVATKAVIVSQGPSSVPRAASSFTSPPPVAPKRCPGSIRRSPTTPPATAAPIPMRLIPAAAITRPTIVTAPVSVFGTRRVLRSITEAARPHPSTIVSTSASEDVGDDIPEPQLDHAGESIDGGQHGNRDECREHAVFDQVLPVVTPVEP